MSNFIELDKVRISENKNIVISRTTDGRFSIVQQLLVKDGNREMKVFVKNSTILTDVDGLKQIVNSLNKILSKEEDPLRHY